MRVSILLTVLGTVASCLIARSTALRNFSLPRSAVELSNVPHRGLLFSSSEPALRSEIRSLPNSLQFSYKSYISQLWTRFRLWSLFPWRRIRGSKVLNIKLSGDLTLEPSTPQHWISRLMSHGASANEIDSLTDFSRVMMLAAHDPRIVGTFIELERIECGYGMLQEALRSIKYYRESGKQIVGYAHSASKKELFLSSAFNAFYMPPEGELNLRGFSSSTFFLRDIFEKLGIEPQVQRIGVFKSFGDQFNRSEISEQQREVTSSILTQESEFWARSVARETNQSVQNVRQIWAEEGLLMPYDYAQRGFISGVRYRDQAQAIAGTRFNTHSARSLWQSLCDTVMFALAPEVHTLLTDRARRRQELLQALQQEAHQLSAGSARELDLQVDFMIHPRRGAPDANSTDAFNRFVFSGSNSSAANATSTSSDTTNTNNTNHTTNTINTTDTADTTNFGATIAHATLYAHDALSTMMHILQPTQYISAHTYLQRAAPHAHLLSLPIQETTSGPRTAIIHVIGDVDTALYKKLTSQLAAARGDPGIRAVVLRVSSPGGDGLWSDLLWREVRRVSRLKPVVASLVDIAASGGYYLAMACDAIVAEELTLTGSIGVVLAKFNLQGLLKKIGINTETISIGRYAEVFSASRGFSAEEEAHFAALARQSYDSFVHKAAASRGMSVQAMEEVAQGRVWTGAQALHRGLVDHIGGLWKALQVAEQLCTIDREDTCSSNGSGGGMSGLSTNTTTVTDATSTTNIKSTNTTNLQKVCKVEILSEDHGSVFESVSRFVRGVSGGNIAVKGASAVLRLVRQAFGGRVFDNVA